MLLVGGGVGGERIGDAPPAESSGKVVKIDSDDLFLDGHGSKVAHDDFDEVGFRIGFALQLKMLLVTFETGLSQLSEINALRTRYSMRLDFG